MNTLAGMRVALLEARMGGELANLIRRAGGEPYSVPAVRESPLEAHDAVEALIDGLPAHRHCSRKPGGWHACPSCWPGCGA
jgi:hypothetical protein